jgi:DNA-directed RNA polymerase subunit M/transcription elongation factor TFIIS
MQKSSFLNLENITTTPDLQSMCQPVNFCPLCGALLKIPNKGAPSLSCTKCRFKKLLKQNQTAKQHFHYGRPREIAVIDKNEEYSLRPQPIMKAICPICGNGESETWVVAVGGDASPSTVTFFRCVKCRMTRRESG